MSQRLRILFISHDASLSGAPVLLGNLVELLQQSGQYSVTLVVRRSGPLDQRFRSLSKVIFLRPEGYLRGGSPIRKLGQVIVNRWQLCRALLCCLRADCIFSNTITNGRLLRLMRFTGKPVITYVHELESAAAEHDLHQDVTLTVQSTRLFAWPSGAVKNMLISRYRIPGNRLAWLPYFFPAAALPDLSCKAPARRQWSEQYGFNPGHLWIAGMGTASRRKGIDLFIETALQVIRQTENISFIWLGGYDLPETEAWVKNRLKEVQPGRLVMTGQVPHDKANLLPFDCFLLTSREDPYPLVVLEAAACGLPTCCFSGSGGIPDFVEADAGWQVPDFSAELMAAQLLRVVNTPGELHQKGQRARQKVTGRHFNPDMELDMFSKLVEYSISHQPSGEK